ncbi:hypothetical protein H4696_009206 [Amycolatopsis lexingtonensis]|uniref:Uncharacterized protein n=1 Tax=Amycolatopsis lexingtonensis TaxID=218822 RepID=A0ABR9IFZ8_9PSEU|nr:hypothetical protein [Amycolatopsis lexingtonensis]MBE1502106.1 hypothetical protein [Amycolatopsis lexingtonensis]
MTDHETHRGAAERQRTCAACGGAFVPGEHTEVEVLLDGVVRYVAVHPGHSTYSPAREGAVAARLRELAKTHQAEEERDSRAA